MKKFTFRLNSVLQLKQQLLRQSQRRLAAIAEQLADCEARRNALQRELAQVGTASNHSQPPVDWEVNFRYSRRLEIQLQQVEVERNELRTKWMAERNVYQLADNEVQGLEKLKEKQKSQHAYEIDRRESADIEEYVLRDWLRGDR